MKYHDPLKQIQFKTRPYWDRDETRSAVRWAFTRALQCRTNELGAEVYASQNEVKIVDHTCKARPCSSCGYRATIQWQRERWAALPDTLYKGITFTMPDVLWPFFRDNPRLARTLPALAAKVIEAQVSVSDGVRVGIMAIPHTFNGKLEFNSHVHTMVTGGGLKMSSDSWVSEVNYDVSRLMEAWRRAVIRLLRTALLTGQLQTRLTPQQTEILLTAQEKRWWSVKIQAFKSKTHFLKYGGRYIRRPPIASSRITYIGQRSVTFWYMDKRLRHEVYVTLSLEEFVDRWAQHIPERYQHGMRNFGLFAPRTLRRTASAIFLLLGQKQKPRPKPRRWADSIKRDFGWDPLLDHTGRRMRLVGRLEPKRLAT
jgi:hypothetical protein